MRTLMAGLLALSLGGLALAQDDDKPEDKRPPAEQLAALKKDVANAMTAVQEAVAKVRKAQQDKDKDAQKTAMDDYRKVAEEYRGKLSASAAKAVELAKADPKSDVGFDALAFAFSNSGTLKDREAVGQMFVEHHLANPRIEQVLGMLVGRGGPEAEKRLRSVIEKNPADTAKARAALTLAGMLAREADRPETKDADIAAKLKAAAAAYEKVAADYPEVEFKISSPRGKAADLAKKEMKALQDHPIGKPVREIEAEDTDGVKFKLSDYRGKVVLLDFWGHW